MKWEKKKPIESKDLHYGCTCCSTACEVAPMDLEIEVGMGSAIVTKNGKLFYDGEYEGNKGKTKTVADMEKEARKDPDNDWRIELYSALHGETFQRHGEDSWVCIESNEGFA